MTTRDEARAELEQSVAAAASSFQQRLAADNAGIAEDMAALDDDRVMRLSEPELYQVGVLCTCVCLVLTSELRTVFAAQFLRGI